MNITTAMVYIAVVTQKVAAIVEILYKSNRPIMRGAFLFSRSEE